MVQGARRRTARFVALGVLVLPALLALPACSNDDEGSPSEDSTDGSLPGSIPAPGLDDGTFTVGTLLPEVGPPAAVAPGIQVAVDAALAEIEASGGVRDLPIAPVVTAVPAAGPDGGAGPLLADGVDVVVTLPTTAPDAVAALGEAGVLVLSAQGLPAIATEGPSASFAAPPAVQAALLGALPVEEGHEDVAVVIGSDPADEATAAALGTSIGAAGGRVAVATTFADDAASRSAAAQAVSGADRDAVVVVAAGGSGEVLAALDAVGMGPGDQPTYVVDPSVGPDLAAAFVAAGGDGASLEGLRGTRATAEVSEPLLSTLQALDPAAVDLTRAAAAYDAVLAAALAAAQAGTDDPAAVAAALPGVTSGGEVCVTYDACLELIESGTDLDLDAASGPFQLGDTNIPTAASVDVLTLDATGAITAVAHAFISI
jgi:branched-chain amino acid transport system substrate-binding protein